MRRIYYAIIAIVLVFFSSCAVFAPNGEYLSSIIYTDITKPGMVTSNVVGTKVGMASATNILGIVSMGDASIQKAAQEAGIKKISHVDVKNEGVLGVYSKYHEKGYFYFVCFVYNRRIQSNICRGLYFEAC